MPSPPAHKSGSISAVMHKGLMAVWFVVMASQIAYGAPKKRISLQVENMTIKEVLQQIEQISDFKFIYEPQKVNLEKRVSLNVVNQRIESVLGTLFSSDNIRYRITPSNLILISPGPAKKGPLPTAVPSARQRFDVSGSVSDTNGNPVADAVVMVNDSGMATVTDSLGRYSIPVSGKGSVLSYHHIGYLTREHPVGDHPEIDITLQESSFHLANVVVVGYGAVEKRSLTNAVSSVTSDDFISGTNSPLMAVQGKISGLSIVSTNGADPNSGVSLQLRGVNSVIGDQGPLVVIDGVPGADMELVAKEDIESVSVLKDASAAAIYGTRASGGVVLITTKRPQVGRLSVNFSTELQVETLARKPDVLSADEFRRYGRTGPNHEYDFGGSTDWYRAVTKRLPFSQRYSIAANGGTDKFRVRASGYYRNSDGIAINNDREEIGGRLGSYFKFLNDRLELSATINYTNVDWQNVDNNMFEWATGLNPTYPVHDSSNESGYYMILNQPYFKNPVAEVKLRRNSNSTGLMLANVSLKGNITGHWSAMIQTAYKHVKSKSENFTSRLHRESLEGHYNGSASHSSTQAMDKMLELTTSYDRHFGRHHLNGVLGYSFQQFDGDTFSASNRDFQVDGLGPWDLCAGSWLSDGKAAMSSHKSPTTRLIAFFGRANYSFDDRYLASVTMRYEGSSKFYNNRWGLFPGISAGWRISSEKFMKNARFVNDLKLRGSFGMTGNQGFDTNTAYRMYTRDSWIYYNGQWLAVYGLKHNQNRDLKWEIKKEFDIGIDFSLFNHRLYGRMDYFSRNIQDVIYDGIPVASPPAVFGLSMVNIGSITNKGFEMELGGVVVRNRDWSYETSVVTSFVGKSSLGNMAQDASIELYTLPQGGGKVVYIRGGQEIGRYYVYRFAGTRAEDGTPMIYNRDNDIIPYTSGVDADRVQTGNGLPKAVVAWNNTVRFRNWELNLFFRSWLGQDVYNVTDMVQGVNSGASIGQNLLRSAYGRNAAITNTHQSLVMDYWIENGSFLKLDAVTLGYTLPPGTVKHIEKLRCYFTAHNVFTITGYTGLDPEVNVNGLAPGFEGMNHYPRTRTFILGVELGF